MIFAIALILHASLVAPITTNQVQWQLSNKQQSRMSSRRGKERKRHMACPYVRTCSCQPFPLSSLFVTKYSTNDYPKLESGVPFYRCINPWYSDRCRCPTTMPSSGTYNLHSGTTTPPQSDQQTGQATTGARF